MTEPTLHLEGPGFETIVDTREISHEEWLTLRRTGIGGSEAAGCFNPPLTRYSSPMLVVMEKLGLVPPIEDNDNMKHGRRMEPVLRREFAELYQEDRGEEIEVYAVPYMFRSTSKPWMLANIDGVAILPDGRKAGLEVKAVGSQDGWRDNEIPDMYYAQIQHYCAVLGFDLFFAPVLIGRRFEYREVPRNDEFIIAMEKNEAGIWEMVQRQEIPAPSGVENEEKLINGMHTNDSGMSIDAPEMEGQARELVEIKAELSRLKKEETRLATILKARMGDAKYGRFGAHVASWPRFTRRDLDTESLRLAMPDIYKQFAVESLTGRFQIK